MKLLSFKSDIGDDFVSKSEFAEYKRDQDRKATSRLVAGAFLSNLVGIGLAGTTFVVVGKFVSKKRNR